MLHLLAAALLLLLLAPAALAQPSRADWYRQSLVSVHCDNHSGLLGKGLSPDELSTIMGRLPIAMIQVSAQSNGYATYPTTVNLTNPGAEGYDTLAAFKAATRAHGQKLCIYMSVDRRPIQFKTRPEWFARRADGTPQINGEECVCQRPNRARKGYLYECFLPQIREIIRLYDPDGFWFDGDYVLPQPCWCANCLAEWKLDTGKDAPADQASPNWAQWQQWHLTRYREYRRLVAETIHQASPKALYTSNWSWAWTPEPAPDFADTLSGDTWSVGQTQAVVQRWGAQDKPWDMMSYCVPAWRAYNRTYSLQRTLQEGALTMAHGGNWFLWSFADRMLPAGVDVTRTCAEYLRDRQAALGPTESLARVAVLDSETNLAPGGDYQPGNRVHSLARALAEAAYCTDLVNEQTFRAHARRYAVLLVPEHPALAPETVSALRDFVTGGGTVLLTGGALRGKAAEAAETGQWLGLVRTPPADNKPSLLTLAGQKHFLSGVWQIAPGNAKVLASFAGGQPALTANRVGAGTVAYLAASGGLGYPDDGLMGQILRLLGRGPSYTVEGSGAREALVCTWRAKGSQAILHLCDLTARVNNKVEDVDTQSYTDYNPVLFGMKVSVPLAQAPRSVRAVPAGTIVKWEHKDGLLGVTLDNFQTHAALIIEGAAAPGGFLPATTPPPAAAFHPSSDTVGVVFSEDFEQTPVGAAPGAPWAAEKRGEATIAVTEETAASGKRSACFTDAADSSFWPFLHRNVPAFRRGRAVLKFDLKTDPNTEFYTEIRFEGKGAGPSLTLDGAGKLNVTDKVTLPPGQWHHWEIEFVLGNEKPGYTLRLTPQGQAQVTIPDLPYATDWFYRCDSVYFVGNGNKPAKFYLDNVVFERLGTE